MSTYGNYYVVFVAKANCYYCTQTKLVWADVVSEIKDTYPGIDISTVANTSDTGKILAKLKSPSGFPFFYVGKYSKDGKYTSSTMVTRAGLIKDASPILALLKKVVDVYQSKKNDDKPLYTNSMTKSETKSYHNTIPIPKSDVVVSSGKIISIKPNVVSYEKKKYTELGKIPNIDISMRK